MFIGTFHRKASKFPHVSALVVCFLSSAVALANPRASTTSSKALVSTGLKNLGNTCYFNAQLQCAFHIPLLRKLVDSRKYDFLSHLNGAEEDHLRGSNTHVTGNDDHNASHKPISKESEAKVALRELFSEMVKASISKTHAVIPERFALRLGIPPMVQQDSQEFWKLLLPALQQESITNLYQGSFEDYIIALDGSGRERRREEIYLDLSLDVSRSSTLLDSLKETFGKPEILKVSEGNGWRPEKGAAKVDAHKGSSLLVNGLPTILQFHFKRFTYDWQTDKMTKLNTPFEFPVELDLFGVAKDVEAQEGKDKLGTQYDLQSIVVHVGEYGMGHYYAYIRPDITGNVWYRFNDHIVEEVTLEEVLRDAFGGKGAASPGNESNHFLGRLISSVRNGIRSRDPCGFGGRTGNAYVVQYVRRSDIPKLYADQDK